MEGDARKTSCLCLDRARASHCVLEGSGTYLALDNRHCGVVQMSPRHNARLLEIVRFERGIYIVEVL